MNNRDKIDAVINTLEQIMIPSTFDNVNRMLGIYRALDEVRQDIEEPKEVEENVV